MVSEKFVSKIGSYESLIIKAVEKLRKERIVQRIWEYDHTVWKPEPTGITNRLGWLYSPELMRDAIDEITSFTDEMRYEGFTHALLLGMGGSSLAPEIFRHIFGVKPDYLDLAVLDSTIPGVVLDFARNLDPEKTLYIASTKSGGTVETLSFTKYFYNYVLNRVGDKKVGKNFIAITDPNTEMESLAKELKFRRFFLNDPNIGGRFSVLSYFGLVPAGLIGVDLKLLLDRAHAMLEQSKTTDAPLGSDRSVELLGTIIGELVRQGRDKLTFIMSPSIAPFGDWVEQLIAESTGKEGKGILPVVREARLSTDDYADDRLFIYLKIKGDHSYDNQVQTLVEGGFPVVQIDWQDKYDLGKEFFRWELATAIAGYFLKMNPFDQPNVDAAKVLARKMVVIYKEQGRLPESSPSLETEGVMIFMNDNLKSLEDALGKFLTKANSGQNGEPRSYVAIQAFIQRTTVTDVALQELRTRIEKKYKLATTVGYGPRFLHSTGQLHKGDSGNGLFIQITSNFSEDAPIPDQAGLDSSSISFGVLALAQALGDQQALLDVGRKVIRFHLSEDIVASIQKLSEAI
jgi:glucose-6-phosphate isomerase